MRGREKCYKIQQKINSVSSSSNQQFMLSTSIKRHMPLASKKYFASKKREIYPYREKEWK
jgi:hypothetical protein